MCFIVWRLLLLLTMAAAAYAKEGRTPPGYDFDFPMWRVWNSILTAARLASDVYDIDNMPRSMKKLEIKARFRSRSTTVLIAVDDDACYFAMAGVERGFEWVTQIDPRPVYIESKDNKKGRRGRCRVVKTYKKLFNEASEYRVEIQKQLDRDDECKQGKQIFMSGHDRGGALATLIGIYFSSVVPIDLLWIVTFGAPPVFMPKQYSGLIRSGGVLREKPGSRTACKALNFDQYIPMYNSEGSFPPVSCCGRGGLVYDFMFFLNFALYSLIRDGPETTFAQNAPAPACLQVVAGRLADYTRTPGRRGNIGHPWGQFVLLPPDSDYEAHHKKLLHHPQPFKRHRGFNHVMPAGLTDEDTRRVLSTEMLGLVSDCRNITGSIHDMDVYVTKLERISGIIPETMDGLNGCFTPCNFDYECGGSNLFRTSDQPYCFNGEWCTDPTIGCARPDDDDQ